MNCTAPPVAIGAQTASARSNFRLFTVTFRFWQPMNGRQKNWKLNVVFAKFSVIALACVDVNGVASGRNADDAVPVVAIVFVSLSVLVAAPRPMVIVTVTVALDPGGVAR